MASNLYHLLHFLPATHAWEMPPALEALAQRLVASGKLRVNADHERNFVRYGTANSDLTFTTRELTDPRLADATHARVARLVAPAAGADGIANLLSQLRADLKKARGISPLKEIRVARVLVQSAHPSVIQLLLQQGTEMFVSYAHNVADLMAVHAWETHGRNSGLQATDSDGTAVYISAGGDPFFEGEQKTYTTDGFPALARMVVIAGQELGHFADLRRSAHGITGRHSTDANHHQLRANPIAAAARRADMNHVAALAAAYRACGLLWLRRVETSVAFYHSRLRYSPPWLFYQALRFAAWGLFLLRCHKRGLVLPPRVLPYHRLGETMELYLADMECNLAPDADVYRHPDPLVEEAIAVIEAVARVPQQTHKWGYEAVLAAWPALTPFYFGTVIPACIAASGAPAPTITINIIQRLIISLRRRLRPKPAYYP
jgi:hypothetical protein